jgi:hypothetical protein
MAWGKQARTPRLAWTARLKYSHSGGSGSTSTLLSGSWGVEPLAFRTFSYLFVPCPYPEMACLQGKHEFEAISLFRYGEKLGCGRDQTQQVLPQPGVRVDLPGGLARLGVEARSPSTPAELLEMPGLQGKLG